MIAATRSWFRRNRTAISVGAGVVGAGYLAGQYVLNKVNEARQRMSDDRIAKENLRRRFQQNQEDCTYTVLALLPTATENAVNALPVEAILQELQQRKSEKLARSAATSEIAPSEVPASEVPASEAPVGEAPPPVDVESIGESGFVHASQVVREQTADDEATGKATEGPTDTTPLGGETTKTKIQLWNDLKTYSITRALTLIYTLALLTLFTRIQLNLLGRRNYLSSVVSLASPPADASKISLENHDDDSLGQEYGNDYETNRKYLTFSWWLLHRGWKDILTGVEEAVRGVFGVLTPRNDVTFERLSELVVAVRRQVEGGSDAERASKRWLGFLLPPRSDEEFLLRESGVAHSSPGSSSYVGDPATITPSLRRLLDETSDLIESPNFAHVLTSTLDAAFSHLVDEKIATQAYRLPSAATARVQEVDDGRPVKLATVLAVFTRQAHAIGSGGSVNTALSAAEGEAKDSNEYLAAIESVRDLEGFAAVVYSSNFEFEAVEASRASSKDGGDETQRSGVEEKQLESAWDRAAAR